MIYLGALNAVDQAESRKASALRSGKYTPEGAKADVLQFAAEQLAPPLRRARMVVDAAKHEAAEKRAQIKLPDKADLVSAMMRAELRDYVRTMPRAERDTFLAQNAETLDPQMALALMEMPAAVSGISQLQRDALVDRALEAQFGDEMRELQELERGIELASRATELAREEIIKESEIDRHQFDQLAAPHEARAGGVPWLRKETDGSVKVVDLQRGIIREPSAEELEIGAFFKGHNEYRAANNLPPVDNKDPIQ